MSEPDPSVGPTPQEPDTEERRGCLETIQSLGMAMYAFLLLGMIGASLLCSMGTLTGLVISNVFFPSELTTGKDMDAVRLAELQALGIIGMGEAPTLYHDHSPSADGSAGCLVIDGELRAWSEKALLTAIPIRGSKVTVSGDPDAPLVSLTRENEAIDCPFRRGEGGDRFARMLRAEAARAPEPEAPQDDE